MSEIIEIASPGEILVIDGDGSDLQLVIEPPPVFEIIEVAKQGTPGPPGAPGQQGERGLPGLSGASYVHDQGMPSDTWAITHSLGRYPSVSVVDSAGSVVEGDIEYLDANTILLSFSAPFAGKAFIN